MKKTILLVLGMALTGCGGGAIAAVRKTVAFDWHCDEKQITVTELSDDNYGASGCGRQTKCRDIPFAGIDCEKQAPPPAVTPAVESQPSQQPPPPPPG